MFSGVPSVYRVHAVPMKLSMMFLTALGTAVPAHRYAQAECWQALEASSRFNELDPRSRTLLKRVLLSDSGIRGRHLALHPLGEAFQLDPDSLHRRFAAHAPELASRAAAEALSRAGVSARSVDALLISTCTGYLCPGLTSYVAERLRLRPDILPLDLVGQGCAAALPNLRAAEALLAAGRCDTALSICVEVCSAAFYLDDDPGVLVSACLFGDGAAAAVLQSTPGPGRSIEWRAAGSLLDPSERDALRFEQRGGMLRNILSPEVPRLAATHAEKLLGSMLDAASLTREEVATWIWHAGGRRVLEAVRKRLDLTPLQVKHSTQVLENYGNLSSPFVYFVLDKALREGAPPGWWWMSSFGAGFSCHGALLKVGAP